MKTTEAKVDGVAYWTRILDSRLAGNPEPAVACRYGLEALEALGVRDLSRWNSIREAVGAPRPLAGG